MVVERAELIVAEGRAEEFERALPRAVEILGSAPGGRVLSIARGIENPASFMLLMEWDSVAAHEAAGGSPALVELDALARSFVAEPPAVGHFEPVG
ncbi:MAG: antibiotic biosynthesis monooxygenase [Actinobacteria bacterium]|nr:antibiotic biosynthesis monooxygenase [Actinomycetota bacterium]